MADGWKSYDWYKAERCPLFVEELDCCIETNINCLPIKLDVPQLSLHHLFWCVENCDGRFHRSRKSGNNNAINDGTNITWEREVSIMAFENESDAIMFRLIWGMEDGQRY